MQPLYKDDQGKVRFKENKIVSFLLEKSGLTLGDLEEFPDEDREQLIQLLGYDLFYFASLIFVKKESVEEANLLAKILDLTVEQRAKKLEESIKDLEYALSPLDD